MGKKSTVAKANSTSPSVRTTIPEEVANMMDILVGDVLDWEVSSEQGKKVVKVRKLE